MASMALMPTTLSKSLGDTSTTKLTLHLVKNAKRSSSTAEVISVLPSKLLPLPTARISSNVPTMTWDLDTTSATILFFSAGKASSSICPGLLFKMYWLPLAYNSNCSSEVSILGAPV